MSEFSIGGHHISRMNMGARRVEVGLFGEDVGGYDGVGMYVWVPERVGPLPIYAG